MIRATQLLTIKNLLLALFEPDELRMFLHLDMGDRSESLLHCLPGREASAEILAYQAVVALDHRGFIGAFFFQRLAEVRPGRIADIERVAALVNRGRAAA